MFCQLGRCIFRSDKESPNLEQRTADTVYPIYFWLNSLPNYIFTLQPREEIHRIWKYNEWNILHTNFDNWCAYKVDDTVEAMYLSMSKFEECSPETLRDNIISIEGYIGGTITEDQTCDSHTVKPEHKMTNIEEKINTIDSNVLSIHSDVSTIHDDLKQYLLFKQKLLDQRFERRYRNISLKQGCCSIC